MRYLNAGRSKLAINNNNCYDIIHLTLVLSKGIESMCTRVRSISDLQLSSLEDNTSDYYYYNKLDNKIYFVAKLHRRKIRIRYLAYQEE